MKFIGYGLLALLFILAMFGKHEPSRERSFSSNSVSPQNYGYSDDDVTFLKSHGVDPAEARAIEEVCGAACK